MASLARLRRRKPKPVIGEFNLDQAALEGCAAYFLNVPWDECRFPLIVPEVRAAWKRGWLAGQWESDAYGDYYRRRYLLEDEVEL
jgi:hypothetical protein